MRRRVMGVMRGIRMTLFENEIFQFNASDSNYTHKTLELVRSIILSLLCLVGAEIKSSDLD